MPSALQITNIDCMKPPSILGLLIVAIVIHLSSTSTHADTIFFKNDSQDGTPSKTEGEILDWTGREIVVKGRGNREYRYSSESIERIDTHWPKDYLEASAKIATSNFDAAIPLLEGANREETRTWARRKILERLLVCLKATGRTEAACGIFLNLVDSDSTTPAIVNIPLAWSASDAIPKAKATDWLTHPTSLHERLLGASHLLASDQRAKAIEVLRALATQKQSTDVAHLALIQIWMTKSITAGAQEVNGWEAYVDSIPIQIRPGAYFIVASSQERLGNDDAAMLLYLRLPIHYAENRSLAAKSLQGAARCAKRSGDKEKILRILEWLVRDFPDTSEATWAAQEIRSLSK